MQGNILPHECAVASNLATSEEISRIFVVISHDCDLAERDFEKEPFVEVVEAFEIKSCNPNYTNSKSTRLLHIEADRNGQRISLELRAVTKKAVDKSVIECFDPLTTLKLVVDEGNTLSHWLAARYKRAAFPNSFLDRLGRKITDAISDAAKRNPHAVVGILLEHDPEYEIEETNELYELWIYIVYSIEADGAEDAARKLLST